MTAPQSQAPREARQIDFAALCGFAAIGCTLLLAIAGKREMWLDEYHSWLLSKMPLTDLWTFVTGDVHPPVYFVMLNMWQRVAGDSALALRTPSMLAYLASAGVFAAIVGQVDGSRLARFAMAVLFAWSPAVMFYGTEVRMYSLATLLACCALWCFFELQRPNANGGQERRTSWMFCISAVLLVLTHYTGLFFLVGVLAAWALRCLRGISSWRPLIRISLVTGVLIGLWMPTLLSQRTRKTETDSQHSALVASTAPSHPAGILSTPPSPDASTGWLTFARAREVAVNMASIAGVYPAPSAWLFLILAAPFAAIGLGIILAALEKDEMTISSLVILLAVIAGCLVVPIARRYLLLSAPVVAVLAGRAIDVGQRRWRPIGAIGSLSALVAFAGCVRLAVIPEPRPISTLAGIVSSNSDPILLQSNYGGIPLRFHLRPEVDARLRPFPESISSFWARQTFKGWATMPLSRDSTRQWVSQLNAQNYWMIAFEPEFQDPWGYLPMELERTYTLSKVTNPEFEGTGWQLFRLTRRVHRPAAASRD